MAQYELNLRDYWRIIRKKKVIVIVTVIMLSGFSFFFAMMNKPEPLYRAISSLRVEKSTDLTGLYLYSISYGGGDDLATRSEIIKSFPMMEKAAQIMGLLDSTLTAEEIRNNKQYFDIVERLKARVKTEQEGYTNLINIIVTDYDPQRTCDLANALAKVYIDNSFQEKNAQSIRALKAIESQLKRAELGFKEAEAKVRIYKEKNNLLLLQGTATRLSTEITELEKQLNDIRSDINQIDNILYEIDQNPDYVYYIAIDALLTQKNSALQAIQTQLNQLATTERQYLSGYTEAHPVVKDIKRQIKEKQNRFVEELKAFRETLVQNENILYEKSKKATTEYRSIPLLDFALQNLERELEINKGIYQQLEVRYQESLIKQSELVHEVFLVRPAFLPTSPINPTMIGPTTAIGTVIGIILGIVLAFVAETLDTTFSTIDDIEKTLETTVLGIVPFVDIEDIKSDLLAKMETPIPDEILQMQARLVAHYDPKSTMAEAFRSLRTNIHFGMIDKGYKSMMVTSSVASEGKTTIAVNLAVSMAQIGLNTLLIEGDLRKPRISKLFGIEREPGLTDVILRRENLDGVIRTMSDLMMGTMATDTFKTDSIPGIEYLNILTAGKHERNPSEIVASKYMDQLISDLKERYDMIIFDSAPVIQATDSTVLGSKVDTTLLVYYQGKISRGTLRRSKNQLEMLKTDILGVILNGMKADVSADYADYRYGYEYQYTYGDTKTPVPKNKILQFLENFFINQQEGLHATLLDKIRKFRVLGAIAALIAFIGSGCVVTNKIKSCSKTKAPTVVAKVKSESTNEIDLELKPELIDQGEQPLFDNLPQGIKKTAEESTRFSQPPVVITKPPTILTGNESAVPTEIRKPSEPIRPTPPEQVTVVSPPASQNTTYQPMQIEEPMTTRQIGSVTPYTIILGYYSSLKAAIQARQTYGEAGLNQTYLSIDFSTEGNSQYIVCFGSYANNNEAKQKLTELQFIGFEGKFQISKLPYAIFIGRYSSKSQAQNERQNFSAIKDFIYVKNVGSVYSNLLGAFTSEETANLFLHQQPELLNAEVVKR
jgi:succinoglycan biosynthesis transport protein ExoP